MGQKPSTLMGRLARPIMVHVCKDRTLSYRQRGQPSFNGRALPVFSVETEEEAEDLLILVGTRVHADHPQLPAGRPWLKLFNGLAPGKPSLDVQDLGQAGAILEGAYSLILARRAA
jgi:hypothetical protein